MLAKHLVEAAHLAADVGLLARTLGGGGLAPLRGLAELDLCAEHPLSLHLRLGRGWGPGDTGYFNPEKNRY